MRILHLEGTPYAWTFARFGDACRELGVAPRHVLHVGGHLGQEVDHYRAAGARRITYMEPTPELAMHLHDLGDDVEVVQAAAGAEPGIAKLSLCGGDGAWNTLRPSEDDAVGYAGVHGRETTIDVDVVPIRVVQREAADDGLAADVLVVDTQGTELDALRSADIGPSSGVRLIIVETQSSGHPEAAHVVDVDAHLAARGWVPVLSWNHEHAHKPHATFADVFYVPASAANVLSHDR